MKITKTELKVFRVDLFKQLVSEISIKRYSQEEFAGVVEAIYEEVFK